MALARARRVTTQPEQDSSLAAMATAIADGYLPTDLERKAMELALIDKALERKIPWSAIGASLGMSGREAKRHAHKLRDQVKRASLTAGPTGEPSQGTDQPARS